jgi:two-component system cell cycle sensor histidine kinase/response regulator CckA
MRPAAWFRPITAIFFLALAILVFIGIQAYRDVRQLLDLQAQRHAALERQQSLDVLLLRLSDTESAQRGFVITGDASYLDAYEAVLRALAEDRRAVQDFFSSDPLQRERLARLNQAIAHELDDLGRSIRLRKGTAGEGADQRHLTRRAEEDMDAIRVIVRTMNDAEGVLAERLAQRMRTAGRSIARSLTLGISVALVLLLVFFYVLNHQVLGRLQAERERRRSEEMLQSLVKAAPLAVIGLDLEGRVNLWNPAAEQIFGWQREETLGRPLPFIAEGNQSEFRRNLEEALRGEEVVGREVSRQRKDGSLANLTLWVVRTTDAQGAVTGVIGIMADVTERKRMEEQFRAAQRMEAIGRLAGGVAHDFNNLLSVILGYSELILERLPADDPARRHAAEIRKAAVKAADLTRQLLAFSRRQVLETRLLNLNVVVADIEKILRRLIGEDVELITRLAPDLGWVKVDPAQTEQVIMNLVVNARDAMPKGGKVTLETSNVEIDEAYAQAHVAMSPGPCVMLAVSDTGTGMDLETAAHIFEPFFTTKKEGTGLGLSTVYGIVKQSGGNIWVYSEPGRGTTFKIYLPRQAAVAAPAPLAAPAAASPAAGAETIMVVEDALPLRELACEFLRKAGYTVLEAPTGKEALAIAAQHSGGIHVLLTDVIMPGLSGPDLARELQALQPGLAVLFMSGYTDDAIVHHGVLEPGVNLLPKPFSRDQLLRKMREVLDKRAPRGQASGA